VALVSRHQVGWRGQKPGVDRWRRRIAGTEGAVANNWKAERWRRCLPGVKTAATSISKWRRSASGGISARIQRGRRRCDRTGGWYSGPISRRRLIRSRMPFGAGCCGATAAASEVTELAEANDLEIWQYNRIRDQRLKVDLRAGRRIVFRAGASCRCRRPIALEELSRMPS